MVPSAFVHSEIPLRKTSRENYYLLMKQAFIETTRDTIQHDRFWDSDTSIFSVWGAHLPVGETNQVTHNANTVEQAPS